jgi:hypothetical protein
MAKRQHHDVALPIDHPDGLVTDFAIAIPAVRTDHYPAFENEGCFQQIHAMLGDVRLSFRFVPFQVQYGLLPAGMLVVKW